MSHPSKLNSSAGLAFVLGALLVIGSGTAYVLASGDNAISLSIEGEDTTIEKAAEALSDG